ncbi:hypothetical protein ON010_g7508 [Phytophthora cinnamomi]|nr:hypothetical protein ON010_g7508 [Phytophthora cinnamomi]
MNAYPTDQHSSSLPDDEHQQQQEADSPDKMRRGSPSGSTMKKDNQDEDAVLKVVFNTEATLAALQPRMNRLTYLHTPGNANLEALARSLGPKL